MKDIKILEKVVEVLNDLINKKKNDRVKPEDFGIRKYKFRPDGTLDVFENVSLYGKHLKELPFNFGKIFGFFDCSFNNLTSLKGSPKVVSDDFYCHANQLENLKYTPKIIRGDIDCGYNNLKTINDLNIDGVAGKIYVNNNPDLIISGEILDKRSLI